MSISFISRRLFSSISKLPPNSCNFKSSLALPNIYPNSNQRLDRIPSPPENKDNSFSGYIPLKELKVTYSRSSGPGGQNVNVLNTKVDIRFHLDSAQWIPEPIRNIMKTKLRSGLTKDGFVFMTSDKTRYQHMNLADALEKMREVIRSCEPTAPQELSPDMLEVLRRRLEKNARERLRVKRVKSGVKESRGAASSDNF